MPTLAVLPTASDLTRVAATCRHAVLLWVADTDLVVRALAGQLAPLAAVTVGTSLAAVAPPDHPVALAARRAIGGEVAACEWVRDGQPWCSTLAPVTCGAAVLGVVGHSTFGSVAAPTADIVPLLTRAQEAPLVFQAVVAAQGFAVDDIVTVRPRSGAIRLHRTLGGRRFDAAVASGVLIPVPHDPASAAAEAPAAPGPPSRHPRAPLRLLRG